MIVGAHAIVYSTDAEKDRAFFRDVLHMPNVDVGGGWLIFGLPPSELAFHPGEVNDAHEFYLLCDDVKAFIADMTARGYSCSDVYEAPWGSLTQVTMPGGGKLGVYQAKHARPPEAAHPVVAARKATARKAAVRTRRPRMAAKTKKPAKKPARKPAKKKSAAKRRR